MTASLAAGLVGCGGGSAKPAAVPAVHADRSGPESVFTIGGGSLGNPVGVSNVLQSLGVQVAHIYLQWNTIAPDPRSFHEPHFDATDPSAYPASGWAPYDALVRDLVARHIQINLSLTGADPLWADAAGAPHPGKQPFWKPDVAEYEQWVQAVGKRYSGHFTPSGQHRPLPRVRFWSGWNEPNNGIDLAPQTTHSGSAVEVAPREYRSLIGALWNGLHATGHGHDRILLGELAPVGATADGKPGLFSVMVPFRFLRALYCVGTDLKPLSGTQAALRGCPTSAAGSRRFRAQNPALFDASGFALHPYGFTSLPPDQRPPMESQDAELANLPAFESLLDRVQTVYGSHTVYPLWSTEYGYITNPPNNQYTVTPALAAYYLNWAQYISWENPRLRSFDQYLLFDPSTHNAFASGLATDTGALKPTFDAYRLPLFLPVSRTTHGHPLLVWGQVRPATLLRRSGRAVKPVQVQFRAAGGRSFRTLQTVAITNPNGYFELRRAFPGSGSVRLRWTYPDGTTVTGRTASVTVN